MSALTLRYDFQNYPHLDGHDEYTGIKSTPDLSITRATTAWMKDADGWLREMQSGEARFPGAAFSNNLFLNSNDLTQGTWTKSNLSVTGGQTDFPAGITGISDSNLVKNTAAGVGQYHYAFRGQTVVVGESYLVSFYAKYAAGSGWFWVLCEGNTGDDTFQFFDLQNGVAGPTHSGTVDDFGMEAVGNGWYRCWVSCTPGVGGSQSFGIGLAENSTLPNWDSTGNADQEQAYVAGGMLEDKSGAWDRDNLLLQSNDFDTTWTLTRSQLTETYATDPFGGNEAWRLMDTLNATPGSIYTQQNVTLLAGHEYLFSIYAKADQLSEAWIQTAGFDSGANGTSYFDLTGGTVSSGHANHNAAIEFVGSGWYRISVRVTSSVDLAGGFLTGPSEGSQSVIVTRDNTSSMLIYGANLERKKPDQTTPGTYASTTTVARTDYSPSTYIPTTTAAVTSLSGTSDGLLIEEARTNLALQSADITTTWNAGQATPVANATTAPDGAATADKLIDDGLTGTAQIYVGQAITGATSTSYTLSLFAKKDQVDHVLIQVADQPGAIYRIFDLADGSLGTTNTGTHTAGIEDYGNGWYRCWLQFTTDAADNTFEYRIAAYDGDTVAAQDRDGTTSIFVWGIQCEAGAFPTAYIPTTTTSVTRNKDDILTTDVSWYSQNNGGTFYTHSVIQGGGNVETIISLNDDTTSERVLVYGSSANVRTLVTDGGVSQAALATAWGDLDTRIVSAVALNDFIMYADGTATSADTSGTLPTVTQLEIGTYASSNHTNGLIKDIGYFPERLDNSTLQLLSAGTSTLDEFSDAYFDRLRRQHYQRQKWRLQGSPGRATWAGRPVRFPR